jgi:hypothetical protein
MGSAEGAAIAESPTRHEQAKHSRSLTPPPALVKKILRILPERFWISFDHIRTHPYQVFGK